MSLTTTLQKIPQLFENPVIRKITLLAVGLSMAVFWFQADSYQSRVDGIANYLYSPGTEIYSCREGVGDCEADIAEYQNNYDKYSATATTFRLMYQAELIGLAFIGYKSFSRRSSRKRFERDALRCPFCRADSDSSATVCARCSRVIPNASLRRAAFEVLRTSPELASPDRYEDLLESARHAG